MAPSAHFLVWRGLDEVRIEAAQVLVADDSLSARGTQIGSDPVPYRLDYELETGGSFVTERLQVHAARAGWSRHLDLRRAPDGTWSCAAGQEGDLDAPPAGGDVAPFAEALDCDLGRCPLTNTMPVRRAGLLTEARDEDFVMAWVSVPDLGVHRSEQRYEHIGPTERGARVRYVGRHRSFVGELELDEHGFVLLYPELAERVE